MHYFLRNCSQENTIKHLEWWTTLIRVIAWCGPYRNQWWPRSILPYSITRLQWFKSVVTLAQQPRIFGINGMHWNICNPNQTNGATLWSTTIAGIILCMRPANERWCYNVTSSLISRAHTQNNPHMLEGPLCVHCISVKCAISLWFKKYQTL